MKKSLLLLILTCSVFFLDACASGSGNRTPPPPAPPSITTTEAQVMALPSTVGSFLSFTFQAVGTGTLTWTAVGLPGDNLSLDPATGTVSGTPASKASVGFGLTVTDSLGRSSPVSQFTITVNDPPPPSITTTQADVTAAPATVGSSYSFAFAASGGLAPLFWSESGMLPSNMTFDTGGVLSGTATATGSFPITVTVKDLLGQKATPQNFTIAVMNPPPPVINTTPAPTLGVVNQPYNFTFTATGGFLPLAWTESGALPTGLDLSTAGTLSGTPTVIGSFPITVMVRDSHGQTAPAQDLTIQIALGFNSTGSMETRRLSHTATLLKTGKVLVAGGQSDTVSSSALATAELYDLASGAFSPTGDMKTARTKQTATLLLDGRVLVAGGLDVNGNALATAELFEPGTRNFSSTGDMKAPRVRHTATLLNDGRVLVAGGVDANKNILASAELFDPATGSFSLAGSMETPRASHTATLLNTGKVLVAGGASPTGDLATAELFDSSGQRFTPTIGNMTVARVGQTATLLKDGRVLLTAPNGTAEIFDPNGETFAATGSPSNLAGGSFATATRRNDGTVLVAGGEYGTSFGHCFPLQLLQSAADAALFDPATGSFAPTGNMSSARSRHTSTLLPNGQVLVTGGIAWTVVPPPDPHFGCGRQKESVTGSAELFP